MKSFRFSVMSLHSSQRSVRFGSHLSNEVLRGEPGTTDPSGLAGFRITALFHDTLLVTESTRPRVGPTGAIRSSIEGSFRGGLGSLESPGGPAGACTSGIRRRTPATRRNPRSTSEATEGSDARPAGEANHP